MIKVVLSIEEKDGVIQFKGASRNEGGSPSRLEVSFTEELLKQLDTVTGSFKKIATHVPMTIIKKKVKKDEHPNRD